MGGNVFFGTNQYTFSGQFSRNGNIYVALSNGSRNAAPTPDPARRACCARPRPGPVLPRSVVKKRQNSTR